MVMEVRPKTEKVRCSGKITLKIGFFCSSLRLTHLVTTASIFRRVRFEQVNNLPVVCAYSFNDSLTWRKDAYGPVFR